MTTSTDDRLRSHLRTLAHTPTRSAEEVERDVLQRVSRRRRHRRHRRQGVALGGVTAIALVSVMLATVISGSDDNGPNVKTVKEPLASSHGGDDSTQGSEPYEPPAKLEVVRIEGVDDGETERVTIQLDAPLPDDRVTEVSDISKVDAPGVAFTIQETSDFWICGDHHWDTNPAAPVVTVLFPESWVGSPENASSPLELSFVEGDRSFTFQELNDLLLSDPDADVDTKLHKVVACGPHEGYVQVAIPAVQSDDLAVSVENGSSQVIVEVH